MVGTKKRAATFRLRPSWCCWSRSPHSISGRTDRMPPAALPIREIIPASEPRARTGLFIPSVLRPSPPRALPRTVLTAPSTACVRRPHVYDAPARRLRSPGLPSTLSGFRQLGFIALPPRSAPFHPLDFSSRSLRPLGGAPLRAKETLQDGGFMSTPHS